MGDLRDELVEQCAQEHAKRLAHAHLPPEHFIYAARSASGVILDSIPPGSYKREDGTWVRLVQKEGWHDPETDSPLYTEVDHAE